ncbi:SRPBCC family protein [Streptomyces albus]|uniref:SRPBCC family protein n=1 Tax=Streptomyces sp. NRRL F-5917 TaxID=1463873 RepID=UPI0004C02898|nr:SRPBCC family protein [Streptomyces sp. NRRL F-5917]
MQLSNTVLVKAPPEEVFSLVNDVERVVSCMPGAALEGRDGDAWLGGVTVKVGPVSASYRGTVRFVRVDPEALTLRVQARGADTHGSGDAEAEVALAVVPADGGAELRLETDLLIRGKIAQFGKGAVAAVSDRLLAQFARNLGALLDQDRTGQGPPDAGTATAQAAATAPRAAAAAVRPAPPAAAAVRAPAAHPAGAAPAPLDGLSLLAGPAVAKYAPLVGAFAFGLFEGWLLGRTLTRERRAARGCR